MTMKSYLVISFNVLNPSSVIFDTVTGQGDHLESPLLELRDQLFHTAQLGRTHRGIVGRVAINTNQTDVNSLE